MTIHIPGVCATSIPAHSIIADFEKAKKDIQTDPQLAALWIPKLSTIPHGYLDFCEKTIILSKKKVSEWLDLYMFKDDLTKKGAEIATWLSKFDEHMTHSRPINYDLALSKGLKVKRLEDDQDLQEKVLSVYHSTLLTFDFSTCVKLIENQHGVGQYTVLIIQPVVQPINFQQAN